MMKNLVGSIRSLRDRALGRNRTNVALRDMPPGTVGRGTYGGATVHHYTVNGALSIGSYCSFAAGVEILLGGNHRHDWVSTFPFANRDKQFGHLPASASTRGDIRIGSDVWVGRGAVILSGVNIGDGAVIGARAVISRDVPPYAIVAGNPGTLIRYRFSPDHIRALLRIAWWDWTEDRVNRAAPTLLQGDIDKFITSVDDGRL